MTTATGPRPMTDAEREAWTLHLQKVPVPTIQARTKLVPSQIAAAVDLGQVHARLAMQSSTPVLLDSPSTTPVPGAAPKPATSESQLTTTKLLAWAEQSGLTRAVTLAARVREYLAELRKLQEQHDARTRAQAEVDRLTAELEAAKNALRQAGGGNAVRAAGTKPDADRLAAIRAWAPGAGFEVAPRGRIAQNIEAAYDAAHGVKS